MNKHFKRLAISASVLVALSACSYLPVETATVEPKQAEVSIPYEKFTLDNGLTVVLHEDHSDPLVHVDVTYHVGSSREEPGKSGFAHFFEHMMFQGSEHVPDEMHFQIVNRAGGNMNGTTNSDRTNYYQTVPANQLERILWLEADRMGFLLDAVTKEKFEVQRETVKNERNQRYDNRPYGLLSERVGEVLYPVGHPYSWQTIGYVEDLDRVEVSELKRFFDRWYGPNNATITIGGHIDPAKTKALIKKYFADIPAGKLVEPMAKTLFTLPETRYISMEDKVAFPLIQLSFPTVYGQHEDEAPLDVLAKIIGQGRSSLFYKNLVKNGIAMQASASHPCRELSCTFSIYGVPGRNTDMSLASLEKSIRDAMAEFEQRGVLQSDIDKMISLYEAGQVYGLESVSGKVRQLAAGQVFNDDPNAFVKEIERYSSVTKDDVMRVYRKYIKDKHAVVMSIVPNGKKTLVASTNEYNYQGRQLDKLMPENPTSDVTTLRETPETFDRSVMPSAPANDAVSVPEVWTASLKNGIKMYGAVNQETPTTSMLITLEGGQRLESVQQAGLADLTASMMNETTINYTLSQMEEKLEKLGSSVSVSAGRHGFNISVRALTKNLDETLVLMMEKLEHPAFKAEDFSRLKAQILQGIAHQQKDPSFKASQAMRDVMYGCAAVSDKQACKDKAHRYSLPGGGTIETIDAISLDDVKAFYQQYITGAKARVIIVGDLTAADYKAVLKPLANWRVTDYDIPDFQPVTSPTAPTIYFVDHPGAAQANVRMGHSALTYDAFGEYFRSRLVNYPLGGHFGSRLNLNLREDKGYTYGIQSGFYADEFNGQYRFSTSIKPAHVADTLNEFWQELTTYQAKGLTTEELQMIKLSFTQGEALDYETPGKKNGFINRMVRFDLPADFVTRQTAIINDITADELQALANAQYKLNEMQIVVVGDAATVKPQLDSFVKQHKNFKLVELPQ